MDYNLLNDGPQPKHVDRKLLYTSLEERIKYLHGFLDFNSADVEALIYGTKYLKPLIPTVVNRVYQKLLETDITSRSFHTRTTVDETEPEEGYLTEETPQIRRRKMFLRWYLVRLCQDPTKMEFWRYLNKVGMMHCGRARMARLNIEYIHIGACLGFVQDIIMEAVLAHPKLSIRRKTQLLRAIGKVLWIQNDLFARWYVRDGEEFADEMDADLREDHENKQVVGGPSASSIRSGASSPIDEDQYSIAGSIDGSIAESITSSVTSNLTCNLTRSNTVHTPSTLSMATACPFADLVKGSTETKIWAN